MFQEQQNSSAQVPTKILKYRYVKENIEQSFWEKLIELVKNGEIQQRENINLKYLINNKENFTNKITFNSESLEQTDQRTLILNKNEILMNGKIFYYDIIENFFQENRENFKQKYGQNLWKRVLNLDLQNMCQILLLVHIDQQQQQSVYQYGMITIQLPNKVVIKENKQLDYEFRKKEHNLNRINLNSQTSLNFITIQEVIQQINNYIYKQENIGQSVFVMIINQKWQSQSDSMKEYVQIQHPQEFLTKYSQYKFNPKWYIVTKEISSDGQMPGMNMMNIITTFIYHTQKKNVNLIMLRNRRGQIDATKSNCLYLQYCGNPKILKQNDFIPKFKCWGAQSDQEINKTNIKTFNIRQIIEKEQKEGQETPKQIQYQQINRNLQIMKENLLKNFNTDIIKNTKCLILGMGTLGCAVSRSLVSWGVQNITLVDNNKVNISNPTRQILYTFNDAQNQRDKCMVAVQKLKEINPNINIQGFKINIPMPGHLLQQNAKEDFHKLEQLIDENDAIFLLTDTRESRWLPTVICQSKNKILINGALGLDSYLVMRHGQQSMLGCYFCNDIIGIKNTVDNKQDFEKCSITRPGLSYIVAGIASELLVDLLQDSLKVKEENCDNINAIDYRSIPHIIRGNLCKFDMQQQIGTRFEHCIGCSKNVISEYKNSGWKIISKIIENPQIVEDISGIQKYFKDFQYQDEILQTF